MELQVTPFRINKKMTRTEIIQFQLLVYCHLKGIYLTIDQLACATLLGVTGKIKLLEFSKIVVTSELYLSNQSSRNALDVLENKGILIKEKVIKGCGKYITLSPELQLATTGNILVEIKCLSINDAS